MVKMAAFGIAAALLLACNPDQSQPAAEEASPPAIETVDVGPEAGSAEETPDEAEDVAAPPAETTEEEASEDEHPEGETPADN